MMRPTIERTARKAIVRSKWDVRVVAQAMEDQKKNVLRRGQARETRTSGRRYRYVFQISDYHWL